MTFDTFFKDKLNTGGFMKSHKVLFDRQGAWIYSEGLKWELLHIEGDYQIWYRSWRQNVPTTYRVVKTDFEEAEVIKDIQTGTKLGELYSEQVF